MIRDLSDIFFCRNPGGVHSFQVKNERFIGVERCYSAHLEGAQTFLPVQARPSGPSGPRAARVRGDQVLLIPINTPFIPIPSTWTGTTLVFPSYLVKVTLWWFNIAMENGPFEVDFPIKNLHWSGIFHGYVSHNQMAVTSSQLGDRPEVGLCAARRDPAKSTELPGYPVEIPTAPTCWCHQTWKMQENAGKSHWMEAFMMLGKSRISNF